MRLKTLLFLPILALVLCSCSSDSEPEPTLNVNPSEFSVNASRTTSTITVSSNSSWEITSIPSWVEVYPSKGKKDGEVNLTILENVGIEERSASFYVSTQDGEISRSIAIKQSGKEVQLSVDITSVILPSTANASQAINILCNSVWTVSGVPDWLQISSNSGNGNSTIVISSRTANESSNIRTATLVLTSSDKTQTITIQQEAALASCRVTPSNITPLWYAVVFNLKYTSEVALTKMLLLSDYDFKHLTDSEVISAVERETSEIPEDETIYTRPVDEDTKYHILSLSYDRKGNRGELVDVIFNSPKYLDETDDAWCLFNESVVTSTQFLFNVEKKGRCATYDIIYGANLRPNLLRGPLMAFEINYFINNKKKNWLSESWDLRIETNYPNDHTFYCPFSLAYPYGGVIATTWGAFSDGTRSSDINSIYSDMYAEEIVSFKGRKKETSEIEWIRNQKGWIKTSPRDFK